MAASGKAPQKSLIFSNAIHLPTPHKKSKAGFTELLSRAIQFTHVSEYRVPQSFLLFKSRSSNL